MRIHILILVSVTLLLSLSTIITSQQLLPNIKIIGYGINMLKGFPLEEAITQPIIAQTISGKNILNIDGIEYIVPDQIIAISDPSTDKTDYVQLYYTSVDLQEQMTETTSFGIKSRFIPGMFSQSSQSSYFNEQFHSYNNSQKTCSTFEKFFEIFGSDIITQFLFLSSTTTLTSQEQQTLNELNELNIDYKSTMY